jgi:hypothetical protein
MQVPLLAGNYNQRTQGQEEQGDTYINQSLSYITIIILLSDTVTEGSGVLLMLYPNVETFASLIRGFFIANVAIVLYLVKSTKYTSRSGSLCC